MTFTSAWVFASRTSAPLAFPAIVPTPITLQSFGNRRVNCRQSPSKSICIVGATGGKILFFRAFSNFLDISSFCPMNALPRSNVSPKALKKSSPLQFAKPKPMGKAAFRLSGLPRDRLGNNPPSLPNDFPPLGFPFLPCAALSYTKSRFNTIVILLLPPAPCLALAIIYLSKRIWYY